MKSNNNTNSPPQLFHWADQVAFRLIRANPTKETFTLASGITPSGEIHIGNFREVITVDLVKRALEKQGKKTRFIFSWDDYDVFRKVPKNIPSTFPNGKKLESYLGQPIIDVPDPFEVEKSYAEHHEKKFEKSLKQVGIFPEYLYQSKKYRSGEYKSQILFALQSKNLLHKILNNYRTKPLEDNWLPINVYCDKCNNNKTYKIKFKDNQISYSCLNCNNKDQINIDTAINIKLLWRIDWPMRWNYEQVDFEPGGKDHSSEGGSYDTAKEISQQIWKFAPPSYLPYDFVLLKGDGGKMSSSQGLVITLADILEVYEPEIVRWIFASYRNNVDFSIDLKTDIIRVYENYDRLERIYYGEEVSAKKKDKLIRIFELSQLTSNELPKKLGFQASFRHLVNVVQINQLNVELVVKYYEEELKIEWDNERLRRRIKCVICWIKKYAPEEFVFSINKTKIYRSNLFSKEYYLGCEDLKKQLNLDLYNKNEVEISDYLYELIRKYRLKNNVFFNLLYLMLIGKKHGPKLGKFIKTINLEKLNQLL